MLPPMATHPPETPSFISRRTSNGNLAATKVSRPAATQMRGEEDEDMRQLATSLLTEEATEDFCACLA